MNGDDAIDRRTLVKVLAAGSAAGALAGCTGASNDPGSGDGSGGDSDDNDSDGGDSDDGHGGGSSADGGSAAEESFGGWMENVSNYGVVVDGTGRSEVTVTVGAEGNGGAFAFDPAAVRIDAGTTVVWEWTGAGGLHNVVAEDGSFQSERVSEGGHAFERAFEDSGAVKYACTPHRSMGMKGVVVVE